MRVKASLEGQQDHRMTLGSQGLLDEGRGSKIDVKFALLGTFASLTLEPHLDVDGLVTLGLTKKMPSLDPVLLEKFD